MKWRRAITCIAGQWLLVQWGWSCSCLAGETTFLLFVNYSIAQQNDRTVTATYELGEGIRGTIGIVGPKRMDYEKVVQALQTVMGQLDTMFKKEE